jgi:hypothetical protein
MIRVIRTEERLRTVITVDGQLSGDAIAVVESCCIQAEPNGKPVQLYLRDVTTVDQTGRMLLSRLAAQGVHLAANGVYISYLVRELSLNGKQSLSSKRNGPERPTRKD